MALVRLESAADARVCDYVALSDAALRQRTDPGQGLYIAEGSKVLRRALAAGHVPRSFFLTDKWLDGLYDVIQAHLDVPTFVGSPGVLEEITGFHLHRGALAAMNRPKPIPVADVVAGAHRVLLLEDIVDHTNLGAIFRSAAALGVDAILVSPRCADPLYRRSIRVSMGGVFQIPWARLGEWGRGLEVLRRAGFTLAALELTDTARPIDEVAAENIERLALILGTEGAGVSADTLAAVDQIGAIPMREGVDSLNVAAASTVAMWELRAR